MYHILPKMYRDTKLKDDLFYFSHYANIMPTLCSNSAWNEALESAKLFGVNLYHKLLVIRRL